MRVLSDHISGRHEADTLIMSLFITHITDIILPDQDEAMRDTKQTICSSNATGYLNIGKARIFLQIESSIYDFMSQTKYTEKRVIGVL